MNQLNKPNSKIMPLNCSSGDFEGKKCCKCGKILNSVEIQNPNSGDLRPFTKRLENLIAERIRYQKLTTKLRQTKLKYEKNTS